MNAADVMVSNVITVGVNASIGEVAAILLNNNISGGAGRRREGRACRYRERRRSDTAAGDRHEQTTFLVARASVE